MYEITFDKSIKEKDKTILFNLVDIIKGDSKHTLKTRELTLLSVATRRALHNLNVEGVPYSKIDKDIDTLMIDLYTSLTRPTPEQFDNTTITYETGNCCIHIIVIIVVLFVILTCTGVI